MTATLPVARATGQRAADEAFDFLRYFEGRTRGHGLFEDRFGRVRAKFNVEMVGTWKGTAFVLDEHFVYDSGDQETRCWIVHHGEGRTFRATCEGAASDAIGRNLPGMVEMRYRFQLPVRGRRITFDFLDRLFDLGEGRALNRVRVSKWGLRVGELTLMFQKS